MPKRYARDGRGKRERPVQNNNQCWLITGIVVGVLVIATAVVVICIASGSKNKDAENTGNTEAGRDTKRPEPKSDKTKDSESAKTGDKPRPQSSKPRDSTTSSPAKDEQRCKECEESWFSVRNVLVGTAYAGAFMFLAPPVWRFLTGMFRGSRTSVAQDRDEPVNTWWSGIEDSDDPTTNPWWSPFGSATDSDDPTTNPWWSPFGSATDSDDPTTNRSWTPFGSATQDSGDTTTKPSWYPSGSVNNPTAKPSRFPSRSTREDSNVRITHRVSGVGDIQVSGQNWCRYKPENSLLNSWKECPESWTWRTDYGWKVKSNGVFNTYIKMTAL